MRIARWCRITPSSVVVDGKAVSVEGTGSLLLKDLYRKFIGDYPKFFKMDTLCRLGVAGAALLYSPGEPREDRAVLIFSASGPLCNDTHYQKTISEEDYFPSPSLFVYTLANIVTGEISIRNHWKGDTSAFVIPGFDAGEIVASTLSCLADPVTRSAICGWAECSGDDSFDLLMVLAARDEGSLPFDAETLDYLYGRTYQEP